MSGYQRGRVKAITFEIEYPDGSTKTAQVDDPEAIQRIVFDGDVESEDVPNYNVSEDDWRKNPAMMLYAANTPRAIPFCTHNGCKG